MASQSVINLVNWIVYRKLICIFFELIFCKLIGVLSQEIKIESSVLLF